MTSKPKLLFLGEGSVGDAIRLGIPAEAFTKAGCRVAWRTINIPEQVYEPEENVSAVIFSRPHSLNLLASYKRAGVPVIVDMDDDFRASPDFHPGYEYVGRIRAFTNVLRYHPDLNQYVTWLKYLSQRIRSASNWYVWLEESHDRLLRDNNRGDLHGRHLNPRI